MVNGKSNNMWMMICGLLAAIGIVVLLVVLLSKKPSHSPSPSPLKCSDHKDENSCEADNLGCTWNPLLGGGFCSKEGPGPYPTNVSCDELNNVKDCEKHHCAWKWEEMGYGPDKGTCYHPSLIYSSAEE